MCSSCLSLQRQPSKIHRSEQGERVIPKPTQSLTSVTVTHDPEEWAAVERVLPDPLVPDPPKHDSYPTPSGWQPQTG